MTRSTFAKSLSGTLRLDRETRLNREDVLSELPPPPAGLSSTAASAWQRLGGLAIEAQTITRFDLELLDLKRSVLWWRRGLETRDQGLGGGEDVVDGGVPDVDVLGAGLGAARELADELEGSGADLVVGGGGIKVEERLDVPTHAAVSAQPRLPVNSREASGMTSPPSLWPRAGKQ